MESLPISCVRYGYHIRKGVGKRRLVFTLDFPASNGQIPSMQTRVLKLKLRLLNRAKQDRLSDMQARFTDCVRHHLSHIHSNPQDASVKGLHAACYPPCRSLYNLPASVVQQARDKALAMYRSYRAKKKGAFPVIRRLLPIRLAAENIRLFRGCVRVTTTTGFLWLPIHFQEIPQHGVSEIKNAGKDWFLMLAVRVEDVPSFDGPHFGVDLGICNIAVLSGPDTVKFFDGKPLRYTRSRYMRYRQELQKKRKIAMVRRSKGKESRWVTDMNHKVSREIVDIVASQGGVLHIEKLLGIRDRVKGTHKVNRMVHSWPFAQLIAFICYKSASAGVRVVEEDPRHTSSGCSRCGFIDRANRPKQALFHCKSCGYEVHADLNAARNLAGKGVNSLAVTGVTPVLNREPSLTETG